MEFRYMHFKIKHLYFQSNYICFGSDRTVIPMYHCYQKNVNIVLTFKQDRLKYKAYSSQSLPLYNICYQWTPNTPSKKFYS